MPGRVKGQEPTALPAWIRILPLGQVELSDSREPFEVDAASLAAMVTAFRSRGVDLVIDYEHQSLQGERAPAAGWIKDLEARPDGLWARVEWTRQAREYLLSKEYRYFSPVLRLDPASSQTAGPDASGPHQRPGHQAPAASGGQVGRGRRFRVRRPNRDDPGAGDGGSMDKIKELLGLGPEVDG